MANPQTISSSQSTRLGFALGSRFTWPLAQNRAYQLGHGSHMPHTWTMQQEGAHGLPRHTNSQWRRCGHRLIGVFSWFPTTPITSFARNGLKRRHVIAGYGRARSRGGQRQGRRSPGTLPYSHREVDSVTLGSTEYISPGSLPIVPPQSKLPPAPHLHRCIGAFVDVTQRASNSHLLLTRRQRRSPSSPLPLPHHTSPSTPSHRQHEAAASRSLGIVAETELH